MIRRQLFLTVVFALVFQIFFSATTDTLPTDEIDRNSSETKFNNCEKASVEGFPTLLFNDAQRRRGGILVHIALILYSFAAIEIVCDDYFASALEKISYNLNLTPVGIDRCGPPFVRLPV